VLQFVYFDDLFGLFGRVYRVITGVFEDVADCIVKFLEVLLDALRLNA
jgi:hypothetical protein